MLCARETFCRKAYATISHANHRRSCEELSDKTSSCSGWRKTRCTHSRAPTFGASPGYPVVFLNPRAALQETGAARANSRNIELNRTGFALRKYRLHFAKVPRRLVMKKFYRSTGADRNARCVRRSSPCATRLSSRAFSPVRPISFLPWRYRRHRPRTFQAALPRLRSQAWSSRPRPQARHSALC